MREDSSCGNQTGLIWDVETPAPGRAVETAAALMAELNEIRGLCGLLRLLGELHRCT